MILDAHDCPTGKHRYPTHKQASQKMNQCKRHGHGGRHPCRAYFCKQCQGWHLTSEKSLKRLRGQINEQ